MEKEGKFVAALLDSGRRAWAASTALRVRDAHPGLVESFGSAGFLDLQGHCEGLIDYLSAAAWCGQPVLFHEHVRWLKSSFEARGVALDALRASVGGLREELRHGLPVDAARAAVDVLSPALALIDAPREPAVQGLLGDDPTSELARRYLLAVLEGRRQDAIDLAVGALDDGLGVTSLYRDVLARTQIEIGRLWQHGEVSVAEEHFVSRLTEHVMAFVNARLPRKPRNGLRVLVTSAHGDLHDIGLRMVADHFDMDGWEPIYLGASTPARDVVRAAIDFRVDLAAISAKLTLHVRTTADLIAALRSTDATMRLPVLVGGHPFQIAPDLWTSIAADGCANTALGAVQVGTRLVRGRSAPTN